MEDERVTILIIDDSRLSRNLLKHYILSEYEDIEILEESEAKKGLETYLGKNPPLTFLDLTMPEMDGFEFLKRVKEKGKKGKIAVLSADVQEISRATALELGADVFIPKPIKANLPAINAIIDKVQADFGVGGLDFNTEQTDAIAEIINIGVGKAAESLSQITGEAVKLSVPEIQILETDEIVTYLKGKFDVKDKLITLQQAFKGDFTGAALLLFGKLDVKKLVDLMLGEDAFLQNGEEAYEDTILEIGNIFLSACVGMFGDTIETHISFLPPRIFKNGMQLVQDNTDNTLMRYAMVAKCDFSVKGKEINGFLVLVISISSMKLLLSSLDKFI